MSPRPASPPPDDVLARLRELATRADSANNDLRAAVVAALLDGASVRTVAAAAGISPTTVQKWKAGA